MNIRKQKLRQIIEQVLEGCGDLPDMDAAPRMASGVMDQVAPLMVGDGGKAQMARGHLYHIANRAQSMHDRLSDDDHLPEWMQSKLAVAEAMINSVYDYIDYKMYRHEGK